MTKLNPAESVSFVRAAGEPSPPRPWSGDRLAFDPERTARRSRLVHLGNLGLLPRQAVHDLLSATEPEASGADQARTAIATSNLLPASFLESGAGCSRAVCLIKASGIDHQGTSGSWSGMGVLVSKDLLLTNHHVLNSLSVAEGALCVFDYQVDSDGQIRPTKTFRLVPSRLFVTSPANGGGLDFTFVWVDGAPGEAFGHIALERSSLAVSAGELVNIVSHPDGEPKAVTIQANQVKWQDELVLQYASDTRSISSGGCIFNSEWKLLALHHASLPDPADALRSVNEGIKLSAIAAQLERWSTSGGGSQRAREALRAFSGTDEVLGFFGTLGRAGGESADGVEAVVDSYRGEYDDVDIACWNIEWFSQRYQEKISAVADAMFRMNVDIWAIEDSSLAAAEALVATLKGEFGLDFDFAASEPLASGNKRTCTVFWNRKTVQGRREAWGEPIETWLAVDSSDFRELAQDAVEGKLFHRYPMLMRFDVRRRRGQMPCEFYFVPAYLKTKDETDKRRRMASEILAAAVCKKIAQGADADWVIGGDFNAELATQDLARFADGRFTPLSAADAERGAVSYLKKSCRSLIDHVFISKNLTKKFGAAEVFIVADEIDIPDCVSRLSDQPPVLLRMSLLGEMPEELQDVQAAAYSLEEQEALDELADMLSSGRTAAPAVATGVVAATVSESAGVATRSSAKRKRGHRRKRDNYFDIAAAELDFTKADPASSAGAESTAAAEPRKHPMLVRLDREAWTPPPGFELQSQMGLVASGLGTEAALAALEADENVIHIEASRPGGTSECATSVPFVKATPIQRPPISEEGDQCLVAFIDTGIDILHTTFLDQNGTSRIVEIWDQTDLAPRQTPVQVYPQLRLNYGQVYGAPDIETLRRAPATVPSQLRDPSGHGTHVASIAVGRRDPANGGFAGGVAPSAKIVLVIAKIDVNPGDPASIGYSNSHFQALDYINAVAERLALPVVVNVSLGMNAGAHDGKSTLEVGFDSFSSNGTKPGRVIVKSAGNERDYNGHAKLTLVNNQQETLSWNSQPIRRPEDLVEVWFEANMAINFRLQQPDGTFSVVCNRLNPEVPLATAAGNSVSLYYDPRHASNGLGLLRVTIRAGRASSIETGTWSLEMVATKVPAIGTVNAWLERIDSRPTAFLNHQSNETTLSVPATAESVVTVAAVNSQFPLATCPNSSYGLTRDDRKKPDLAAPGTDIVAAQSRSVGSVVAKSGTSMAAPHVSGAIALALSYRAKQVARPWLTANQVRLALNQRTVDYNGFHSAATGYGLLDAHAFFQEFYP